MIFGRGEVRVGTAATEVRLGVKAALLYGVVIASPVLAQEVPTNPTSLAAAPEEGGLQEIVVTAQKRSERLQDVPIAITALQGDSLTQAGVTDTLSLARVTPGLSIGVSGAGTITYIRGIGTQNSTVGIEPSVAVYIDGVYQSAATANVFKLANVERIEVLKGPQGTLFGRNATGGLISIITRTPSFNPGADVSVSVGTHQNIESSAYVTGGISDNVAADLALRYSNQGNGFGHNLFTGSEINKDRDFAARSKLLINISDVTTITLAGNFSQSSTSFGLARRLVPGAVGLDGTTFNGGFWDINSNLDPYYRIKRYGGSARVDTELAGMKVVSISAYQRNDGRELFPQPVVPTSLLDVKIKDRSQLFTQELQLLSDNDGPLSWIVGGFFMRGDQGFRPITLSGPLVGGIVLDIFGKVTTTSYSAFAQGTYALGERTNLTAGIRYTSDKRELDGRNEVAGTILNTATLQKSWSKPSWRLSLDHKLTPEILVYGSYNRGFKSGIISSIAFDAPPANPETLDAFEIGLKATDPGKRVRVNAAAFYYKYKDIQLAKTIAGTLLDINAARATVKGFDLDGEVLLTDMFRISFGASYVDGTYTSFPDGPIWTPNPAGGNIPSAGDLSGGRLVRTPRFSGNVGASLDIPLSSGAIRASTNLYYSGRIYWEPENRLSEDPYAILSAELSYNAPDDHWRVWIYGRNLTNTKYAISGESSAVADQITAGQGRLYGVGFGFKF